MLASKSGVMLGMMGPALLHLLPYGLSAAISTGVAAFCLRRRREAGAIPYAVVALSQASWTLGYMAELASPTLAGKVQWDNFQFIGLVGWAVGMVAFTLTFTGRSSVRAWGTAALVGLPLAGLVILAYTDGERGIIRQNTRLVPGDPFSMLLYDFTPPMWATGIYAYGCFVLLSGILAVRYLRVHRLYRRQVGLVLAGSLVPILGTFATLTILRDSPDRDLTPLTFAIGNLLVGMGILHYHLFDVVPVARDTVFEAIDDAVFVLDSRDRLIDLNPFGRELLGPQATGVIGREASDVIPGWPGLPGELHRLQVSYDGDHSAEISAYALPSVQEGSGGRVLLWRDVTRQKRMEDELRLHRDHLEQLVEVRTEELREQVAVREQVEQQFRQAQKMEAVGRMAGGIAHDFNNLLQALTLNLEGLAARLPELARAEEYADVMVELDRATKLIRHLLLFSRRQTLEPQVLDLNAIVERSLPLIRRAVGPTVRLTTKLDTNVWPVYADGVQLEQVLLNLAINARDAMIDGGDLVMRTRRATLTGNGTIDVQLDPGDYVVLDVVDTGHGMDLATQGKIFDPFFTTKEPGKGTGLGLSTVYGIVRQSGGAIDVVSAPNAGATFTIYLPRAGVVPATTDGDLAVVPAKPRLFRAATVLLVEDAGAIRRAAQRLLERGGFEVLEARDGVDALRRFDEHRGHVHLVITDLGMPTMGGAALVRELRARRPDLPVVIVSGDSEKRYAAEEFGGATVFLHKPFLAEDLVEAARRLLDEAYGAA